MLTMMEVDGTVFSENDDGMGDYNAECVVYLAGGSTYRVKAEFYGSDAGSCTLLVKPPIDVPAGGGQFNVTAAQGFEFVPGQSGTWELRTSDNGGGDPFLFIYDIELNNLGSDSDSGGDNNALLSINLTAGETYYVYAGFYELGPITYTMTVTRR